MTENKQIEEMALVMCGRESCMTCTHFVNATKCAAIVSAKKLYKEDYRKTKHGKWRLTGNANGGFCGGILYYRCTCCGYEITQVRIGEANFCEWCGADMRGENDEKQ